jgi:hypothetical protein
LPCCSWARASVPAVGGLKGRAPGWNEQSLAPLEPLKAKINIIDGLFNKAATDRIHPAMTGNMLSRRSARFNHSRRHHRGPGAGQPIRQETPRPAWCWPASGPLTRFP